MSGRKRRVREPSNLYATSEKESYREDVWSSIRPDVPEEGVVAFLPGRAALDVPVAHKYGFRNAQLLAVDESAAMLATAPWRAQWPDIKCYGTEIGRSVERMVADGMRPSAVIFDSCSCFGEPLFDSCTRVARIMKTDYVFSLTVLKGRESAGFYALMNRALSTPFRSRIMPLRMALILQEMADIGGNSVEVLAVGEYPSGTQVMQYCVVRFYCTSKLMEEQTAWGEQLARQRGGVVEKYRLARLFDEHPNYRVSEMAWDRFVRERARFQERLGICRPALTWLDPPHTFKFSSYLCGMLNKNSRRGTARPTKADWKARVSELKTRINI